MDTQNFELGSSRPLNTSYRITRLQIAGMRLIEDLDLDLHGLRVLIGENGSGKSTILEALEILRRTTSIEFWKDLCSIHGGFAHLIRPKRSHIELAIEISPLAGEAGEFLRYEIRISRDGVEEEHLRAGTGDRSARMESVFLRQGGIARHCRSNMLQESRIASNHTALAWHWGTNDLGFADVTMFLACAGIEVHVPFEVRPTWITLAHGLPNVIRGACLLAPAPRLERLGTNLPNAYQALRNELSPADWNETMDWIRLGLGDWIETVSVRADASGGNVALWVKHAGVDLWLPARSLSEGELQYLGIVALCRLGAKSSIVAIDEPEAHLHPHLQQRVMQLLEKLAEKTTVLVSTHSRHMLDALTDPAKVVRVCRRTEGRPAAMELRSLDTVNLASWMKDYAGLGRVLDEGLEPLVVHEGEPLKDGA